MSQLNFRNIFTQIEKTSNFGFSDTVYGAERAKALLNTEGIERDKIKSFNSGEFVKENKGIKQFLPELEFKKKEHFYYLLEIINRRINREPYFSFKDKYYKYILLVIVNILLDNHSKTKKYFSKVLKVAIEPEIQSSINQMIEFHVKIKEYLKLRYNYVKAYMPKYNLIIHLSLELDYCEVDQENVEDYPLCFLKGNEYNENHKYILTSNNVKKNDFINSVKEEFLIILGHGNDVKGMGITLNNGQISYLNSIDLEKLYKKRGVKSVMILGCAYQIYIKSGVFSNFEYFIGADQINSREIEIFLTGFLTYYRFHQDIKNSYIFGELALAVWTQEDRGVNLYEKGIKISS